MQLLYWFKRNYAWKIHIWVNIYYLKSFNSKKEVKKWSAELPSTPARFDNFDFSEESLKVIVHKRYSNDYSCSPVNYSSL